MILSPLYMGEPVRSISLGKYTEEEIQNIMGQAQKMSDMLMKYINDIRNFRELPEDTLEKIATIDDNSKMIIIREYNRAFRTINQIFNDDY